MVVRNAIVIVALALMTVGGAAVAQTASKEPDSAKLGTSTDEFRVKKSKSSSSPSKSASSSDDKKSVKKTTSPGKPEKQKLEKAKTVKAPEPPRDELQSPKQQAVTPPERVSTVFSRNPSFNTDYKTRGASAAIPEHLHGSGYNGRNIPIGGEDQYRQSLPADYMPSDLVRIPQEWCYYKMPLYLRKEAADSLLQMFTDASRQGLRLYIFSGYRDYRHQQRLYAEAVRKGGPNQKNVAKPGRSEHALGTTADVTNGSQYLMKRTFATTPEGQWLMQNAPRYGWKMTVMSGTGRRSHADEPWHIRYLGTGKTPTQSIASSQSLPSRLLRAPGGLFDSFKKSLSKMTESLSVKRQLNETDADVEPAR